ncbi:MAG: hypothetical protein ACRD1Z_12845, partial [Vicinamibacteria bacterium]
VEECLKAASGGGVQRMILSRADRSALSRRLFGSAVEKVREQSPVEVEIVEENEAGARGSSRSR